PAASGIASRDTAGLFRHSRSPPTAAAWLRGAWTPPSSSGRYPGPPPQFQAGEAEARPRPKSMKLRLAIAAARSLHGPAPGLVVERDGRRRGIIEGAGVATTFVGGGEDAGEVEPHIGIRRQ